MDPVSHILFGRMLSALDGGRRLGRGGLAALVLGSIAPDVDILLVPFGFDTYLYYHELGTHSLPGAVAVAALVAGLVRGFVRGSRASSILLAAMVGVGGHIFWDLASGADIRLLHPVSDHRVGWHLVTMGEPAVLLLLLLATLLRPRGGRRWATAVLSALMLLLGAKSLSRSAAERAYQGAIVETGPPDLHLLDARPSSLFAWGVLERRGERLRCLGVDARTGDVRLEFERRSVVGDLRVLASERLRVVRNLRRVALFPLVWLEKEGAEQSVFWSDFQFCDGSGCVLSFGASFDERLQPIREIVRIGALRQVRSPQPEEDADAEPE